MKRVLGAVLTEPQWFGCDPNIQYIATASSCILTMNTAARTETHYYCFLLI